MTSIAFLLAALLGTAGPAVAAPSSDAAARDANNWDVILNQYPARARAAGEQGAVGFRVSLDRDGYASACEVTRSSGYSRLDNETCELIMNRATFKGVKDGGGRKVSSVHEGVLNWRLPGAAAATPQVQTASAKAAGSAEKLICKRKVRTGSLAGYERTCLTRAEWQRFADRTREEWGELQGTKGNTNGN
jgi:TonB family protein